MKKKTTFGLATALFLLVAFATFLPSGINSASVARAASASARLGDEACKPCEECEKACRKSNDPNCWKSNCKAKCKGCAGSAN